MAGVKYCLTDYSTLHLIVLFEESAYVHDQLLPTVSIVTLLHFTERTVKPL